MRKFTIASKNIHIKISLKIQELTHIPGKILLFFVTVPLISCGDMKDNQFMASSLQLNLVLSYRINLHISFYLKHHNFDLFRVLRSGQEGSICPSEFKPKT